MNEPSQRTVQQAINTAVKAAIAKAHTATRTRSAMVLEKKV